MKRLQGSGKVADAIISLVGQESLLGVSLSPRPSFTLSTSDFTSTEAVLPAHSATGVLNFLNRISLGSVCACVL